MNQTLPTNVREALLGKRVAFILRGWPGLGRVMQGFSLSQILQKIVPTQEQVFYSSLAGFRFLSEQDVSVNDIGTGVPLISWLGGVDQPGIQHLLRDLQHFDPEVVVLDGEVGLLPVLRTFQGGPLIALANPYDLMNPKHTIYMQLSLRSFYLHCNIVVCGSFFPISKDFHPLPRNKVYSVSPLVRDTALVAWAGQISNQIVVVLGGGSHSDGNLQCDSEKLLRAIADVATHWRSFTFYIYGVDSAAVSTGPSNVVIMTDLGSCLDRLSKARLLIARAGRNITSEALTIGIPTILVPGSQHDYRSYEQRANTHRAQEISSNIVFWGPHGSLALVECLDQALHLKPTSVSWEPGNQEIQNMLKAIHNSRED